MTVEFDKLTTKLFRVSDLGQKAIKRLWKEILSFEVDFLKNSGKKKEDDLDQRKRPQSSQLEGLSHSEQHYLRLGNKAIIKNAVHSGHDKPFFIANFVYDKPIPRHLQERVLSADKRQQILTGISAKTRPVSKAAAVEEKVREINIEQNKRNKLMDSRSQKAHIEDIKKARLRLQAVYGEDTVQINNKEPYSIKRAESLIQYQSDKTIPKSSEDFPQPIEDVEKQYKKMKSMLATSALVGMTGKSNRMIQTTDPEP